MQISDVVLTEVEDLMARGRGLSGAVEAGANMADEFHVVKGKNEELQKELAKLSAELQAAKEENRTKDSEYAIINAKGKSESTLKVEMLEKQLSDSASTISLLEIEVLREKERADRLQDTLIREQKEKDEALSTLRVETEAVAGKKMANDREKAQVRDKSHTL